MYSSYSFAQSLRAKSPFPYCLLPSSSSPSDQDFFQNPYYNPNPHHRLPLSNGYFSRQSTLLYFHPSRTFFAAAATYLATSRRSQVKLSHCTASSGSRSCCVTVREIRCCHSHCCCDLTRSRDERNYNKARDQKIVERELIHARQAWRCNEDYECECSRSQLIERDVKRGERSNQHRVPDNTRIEEHYDYSDIDNSKQKDDNSRNSYGRRRDGCEHDYGDNQRIRLSDRRRRRDGYDEFSGPRRRAESYESDDKIRFSDRRRRAEYDERDDNIRFSDQRRRTEYDYYDVVDDARNRDDKIRFTDRRRRDEYDYEDVDDYRTRRADQIKFADRKGNQVYNERDDKIRVSEQKRRDESFGEDKVRFFDGRRDEHYGYDEEDKIRVLDRRRREDCTERGDRIRFSDQRKQEENYDYAGEDNKMKREDRIRVSDRRGREVYDGTDNNIRVSDRRRKDEYYDYDNEDKIKVSDRRRYEYYDYDNENKIRVSDRRRKDEYYDYDKEDKIRGSDRRRDEYYDYDNKDKSRMSDRRRRDEYYKFDGEDKIRISDRRRKEVYEERDDTLRVMDKRRRDAYYDYDEDDRIRVSDRRRRDEFYDYNEEGKIRVFDQKREGIHDKEDRIRISDHRSREEADDYDEMFTNLQQRDNAIRVSDSKLERQSRLKETRAEASTSQFGQNEEREGKYREEAEHYDQRRNSKEGSQIVKIISEDDSSLVSRERKNGVNQVTASEAQLNLQSKTQIGTQRQPVDSSTSVGSQVAIKKDKANMLNQFSASEVETDEQNRTHIYTGGKKVDTSSSFQNQIQVSRDKRNIVNQLVVSETELDVQNRTNVDVQRKTVDTSSSVQNVSQVVRDKRNVLNQFTVTEVESDLQNRSQIEAERRRVDSSTSVQNVAEFTRNRHNVANQHNVSEMESDVQNRNRIEAERRKADASTSVENVTQFLRDKHNIVNQLTWSEVESYVQNQNQIEAERRQADSDTSVQNVTQIASGRQKLVDQLSKSEVELDLQKGSQTDAEMRRVDNAASVHSMTQGTEENINVLNQLTVHETEVNVLNKTDLNLTRVHLNDTNSVTDNSTTETGSGASPALIQASGSGIERVGSSGLAAESCNATSFTGSLESASQLEKSSSYHVGQFVDSVHEELLGGSESKGPSDEVWDLKSSVSHGTYKPAASGITETDNTVTRRHGRSLWAFVADVIKLGFLKHEAGQLKSGKRSSSSDSRGTDDWFSGQEEIDLEMKNQDEKKELLVEQSSEAGLSSSVKVPEVDLSATGDGTVIAAVQEKTVVEEDSCHESTSVIGETGNFSSSTTFGVQASGLAGTTLRLGERIIKEEIPKTVKYIGEKITESGSSNDLLASGVAGEISASAAAGGLLLEEHTSRVTESGSKGESKRGKQLKRITQIPKSSFDEWEEECSREREKPAIDSTGQTTIEVSASGVTRVPDVSTSRSTATLELQPSAVTGHPSALASSSSATLNVHATGGTRIEGGKIIDQVRNKSIVEYEETKVGKITTAASDSTTVITELPTSGAVERHGSGDKGSRKHLTRLNQAPRESFEEWEEAFLREKEQRRLDEFFMREALVEAQRASDSWEVPVGAVLVRNGEVIARGCNLVEELRDSTAHAEMVCIREASNLLHSWRLSDTTLYVTLEPCAMCAGAILQARIDTVVWGAPNKLLGADGSWVRLFPGDAGTSSSLELPLTQAGPIHPFHPKIIVRRGILEDECSEIMQQFFKLRRKKKSTKSESSSNPSCLPAHPFKFFSRFTGMFCI